MPSLPAGKLTFGQIADLAVRRVGNPGLASDARLLLSQVLFELYTGWEWPFLNLATAITVGGNTFTLPTDFLKTQDDRGLTLATWDGASAFGKGVKEVDRFTFDAVSAGQTSQGMPDIWHPDRNAGIGLLFPDPTGHLLVVTLRYKQLPSADTAPPPASTPSANDALIPAFPYHLYLVQHLFVLLLQHEKDNRADGEEARRDRQFTMLRQAAMPLRSQQSVIPLDDEVFGPTFSGDGSGF